MMQADSGNWHPGVDDQTVQHELAHGMGLPDEYVADYYPMNNVGENNSMMVGGQTLYPRHLEKILDPTRCD
ncbi:MAG: hypothetical protein HY075_01575 [Deltaproteobacteria bacterium]|nr:hypothetical protein [Deltaproteobacteria bacterium]